MHKPKKLILLTILLMPVASFGQNTFSDPDVAVKERFWGNLYAEGGETFFCKQPFTSRGFVLTEGYIYPLVHIRNALKCGTSSQCQNNQLYLRIASDLHNMVPVQSRIEMRRRNAKYDEIGGREPEKDCGLRESTQFIEPPDHAKGQVARTVAYMVSTYDLPWIGLVPTFRAWSNSFPPDEDELARHSTIVEIQGNANPFVEDPSRMAGL